MKVLSSRSALLRWRSRYFPSGRVKRTIGFVPTMGALHEGHLSLVRKALKECDDVVVSIFVNPTQFGPNEDFSKYPRTLKRDLAQLQSLKSELTIFTPKIKDIYPRDSETAVRADPKLSSILCGAFRPGHFDGVCTVVLKLLQMVRPNRIYLGQKDYQQLQIIKQMVQDFLLNVEVVGCPTVREKSGLALSSRNSYLETEDKRRVAALLYECLRTAPSKEAAIRSLSAKGFQVQYLEIRSDDLLEEVSGPTGRWLAAVYFEGVRLIDNVKRTA